MTTSSATRQASPSAQANVSVRRARTTDADVLVDFNRRLALETEGKRLGPDILHRGVTQAISQRDLARYYVAERDGRVVGQTMVTYEWSDWRANLFWWIQSVYVEPKSRRRGVFRALFRHIEQEARRTDGVCGVRLYVARSNQLAMRIYHRLNMAPSRHLVYELDWSDPTTAV